MNDRFVVVFDKDRRYSSALSDCINRNKTAGLMSCSFSDREKFAAFLIKRPEAFLLAGSGFDTGLLPQDFNLKRIIVLTESKSLVPDADWLYKYQSADCIIEEILKHIDKLPAKRKKTDRKIHGLISFDRQDAETFDDYIEENTEEDSLVIDFRSLMPSGKENISLTDLIYCIEEGAEGKAREMLESTGGVNRIDPVRHFIELYELSDAGMRKLADILTEKSQTEDIVLIFDISTISFFSLLKICDEIKILCFDGNGESMSERMRQDLALTDIADISDKVRVERL